VHEGQSSRTALCNFKTAFLKLACNYVID